MARAFFFALPVGLMILAGFGTHDAAGQQVARPSSQPSLRAGAFKDPLPPAPAGKTWQLVFEDNFDGRTIDTTKWSIRGDFTRKGGWWMKSACTTDGRGHLRIRTEVVGGKVTSGAIDTAGKFEHAYGYWVCRAKVPKATGFWAAFWLMCPGVGSVGDEGRDGTEIDICELPKRDGTVNYALHWDGYGPDHKVKGSEVVAPEILRDWATYSLLWTPEEYVFYLNGRETWRSKDGGVSQVPEHAILSTEVGTWAGAIVPTALPDEFLVDAVRVYDLKQGWDKPAPPATPTPNPANR